MAFLTPAHLPHPAPRVWNLGGRPWVETNGVRLILPRGTGLLRVLTPLCMQLTVSPRPPSLQWDEVSVLDDQRRLTRTFEACHVAGAPPGTGQDNWLQTHFVERRGAQRAHIRLHFSVRACASLGVAGGTCRETFTLYYRQAEEPDGPDSISSWHLKRWTKVDTIAADESFPASSAWAVGPRGAGQRAGLQLNVKERSFGPLTQRGFYVAFQDTGACLALVAVKLFSYTCPSVLRAFASFPETQASGAGGASLVAAVGTCVAHAEPEEDGGGGQAGGSPPRLHCNGEGKWMVAVGGCRCQPGHQPARGDKACQGEILPLCTCPRSPHPSPDLWAPLLNTPNFTLSSKSSGISYFRKGLLFSPDLFSKAHKCGVIGSSQISRTFWRLPHC